MARVPVQRRRRSISEFSATPIDPRQIESAYGNVARAAESLRDAVDVSLVEAGRQEGAKAVTKDADGNIRVERPGFAGVLFPEYAEARQNAALAAYLAEQESAIRENLAELRKKNPTDSKAFNTDAMAFARRLRDQAQGGFGPEVFNLATREVERVSRGIQASAERIELQKQEGALRASIAEKENTLLALARQGGTDTEDYRETAAAYRQQMSVLVNNPLFAFSQEEAAVRVRNLDSRSRLEASGRNVMGVYEAKGEAVALQFARKTADDPKLNLTEPQREEWLGDIRVRINEREAAKNKAKAGLKRLSRRRLDDVKATYLAGGDPSQMLNDPTIWAGLDDVDIELEQEEIRFAKATGQALKQLNGADPATRAKILNSVQVQGPGAALAARQRVALEQEAADIARRLDKDPVSQVTKASPELVSDLGEAIKNGDAAAFDEAAVAMLEEQMRLGANDPRLLSASQRAAITATVLGEEDDENRTANLVAQIARLSDVAGVHFPRVMAELAEEGDFPAAAYGVGLLENRPHAQFLLAKAALEDQAVLRENVAKLGRGAAGDLRDNTGKAIAPLVRSLSASGFSQTHIDRITDSVDALASQFAVEQGKVGGAGKKAFDALFGGYTFEDSYRVPDTYIRHDGKNIALDPEDIRLGVAAWQEGLQPNDFVPPRHDPRIPLETAKRMYLSSVKSSGHWVTNRDETGLILVDEQGQPVMERPKPGEVPRPHEVGFDQLVEFARQHREALAPTPGQAVPF